MKIFMLCTSNYKSTIPTKARVYINVFRSQLSRKLFRKVGKYFFSISIKLHQVHSKVKVHEISSDSQWNGNFFQFSCISNFLVLDTLWAMGEDDGCGLIIWKLNSNFPTSDRVGIQIHIFRIFSAEFATMIHDIQTRFDAPSCVEN